MLRDLTDCLADIWKGSSVFAFPGLRLHACTSMPIFLMWVIGIEIRYLASNIPIQSST